jgi:hypothetical protein
LTVYSSRITTAALVVVLAWPAIGLAAGTGAFLVLVVPEVAGDVAALVRPQLAVWWPVVRRRLTIGWYYGIGLAPLLAAARAAVWVAGKAWGRRGRRA